MRLVVLALVIILPIFSYAQSFFTVSGLLEDSETGEPLVFASIGIKGKPISTVSNAMGEFDFHVPEECKNEYLKISMLGYKNYEAPLANFIGRDTVILKLEKAVQVLDEVVITDSLNGGEIVRIALSRIEKNYPMKPYLMDGFYRDLKKLGGTYFSLLEAAVKIYDEDYGEPRKKDRLREKVALMEVRKSLSYETHKFSRYFDQHNLLEDLLLHNNIKYRTFPGEDSFFDQFERLNNSYYNGYKIYAVYLNTDLYTLKMYIDQESYSIIRMEYQIIYPDNTLKKKVGSVSRYISDTKVIGFKQYEDKMYLNYIKVVSQFNWYDAKTNDLNFETEMHQELLINKVYPHTAERISSTKKMKRYGLQYQDEAYNKDFWDNYNVIKDTPLDKEIVADLEKLGSLDEQFKND